MLVLYRRLLRLYPGAYWREYGAEMVWVFTQANQDANRNEFSVRVLFYTKEILGVITGALKQRLFGYSDWNSSRRFDMRPEFRFPRSAVFLMWVILAGVFLAIAEAKKIAMLYGPTETRSVWSMLPWFPVVIVLLVFAAVSIGWFVLFALRRTGVQRLENLDTASE